jgi:hypothetical protein
MKINNLLVLILSHIFLIPYMLNATVIDWISEVKFEQQAHKVHTSLIQPVDHYSPQWNCDGTMLSLLEEDENHKTTLHVCKVDLTGQTPPKRIYTFPKRNKVSPSNQSVPGSRHHSQQHSRSSVEMVSWSPNNSDLLIFQYAEKLYFAKPSIRTATMYELGSSYREYPKLKSNQKYPIIFGENGSIVNVSSWGESKLYSTKGAWRASNPIYVPSLSTTIFELFDPRLDAGIYWQSKKPLINFPDTAEILPTLSPNSTKLAFISNSGNIIDTDRKSFNRNQWHLYVARLTSSKDSTGQAFQICDSPIQLSFMYGYPGLYWKDDNSILFIQKDNLKPYVAKIHNQTVDQLSEVHYESQISGSAIRKFHELAYHPVSHLIAVSAYRKANECRIIEDPSCYRHHHRIYIGRLR